MHLPGSEEKSSSPSSMPVNVAAEEPDFSEFMWMAEEDLESFDHQVIREVEQRVQRHLMRDPPMPRGEEEAFLQQMLDEEEARDTVFFPPNGMQHRNMTALQGQFQRLQMAQQLQQQQVQRQQQNGGQYITTAPPPLSGLPLNHAPPSDFKLNPEAPVFVPRDDGDDGSLEQQNFASSGSPSETPDNSATSGV